jgi:hypothetical protein
MDREMWVVVSIVGFFFVLFIGIATYTAGASCRDVAEQTGHETRFSRRSGCYIHIGDEWMPLDRFNNVRMVSP